MMNESLLTTLVERNLVTEETLVYANVKSRGLGGKKIFIKKDVYWYPGMPAGAIHDIEGMLPDYMKSTGWCEGSISISEDGTGRMYTLREKVADEQDEWICRPFPDDGSDTNFQIPETKLNIPAGGGRSFWPLPKPYLCLLTSDRLIFKGALTVGFRVADLPPPPSDSKWVVLVRSANSEASFQKGKYASEQQKKKDNALENQENLAIENGLPDEQDEAIVPISSPASASSSAKVSMAFKSSGISILPEAATRSSMT